MASLNKSRMLFFTTSPRSPMKMIPEIELLTSSFSGKKWDKKTQIEFVEELIKYGFFNGSGSKKNLDLSARDRINRAPKALGFVDLKPTIALTDAGQKFIDSKRKDEVLLRQLLKFQLPSPFHTVSVANDTSFWVKPYLEIFRLIYEFGSISFDELMLYGMQLTDYNKFDEIVKKIEKFRVEKLKNKGKYKIFLEEQTKVTILEMYHEDIINNKISTRESDDISLKKFLKTKKANLRDYTDACFRYLRETGLVNLSYKGKSLSIHPQKKDEVKYFLETISRDPQYVKDEKKYKEYLYNSSIPQLYTDNKASLIQKLKNISIFTDINLEDYEVNILKELWDEYIEEQKSVNIDEYIKKVKNYEEYNDILDIYLDIERKQVYDAPLLLEWNTWRAMTMLDGGSIKANLKFDDFGKPISTAQGNVADIECDYPDYCLAVEVTMSSGAKQYEMEGESVSRHLAKLKEKSQKNSYCLFIAPKVNEACVAHFYTLHKVSIAHYGGKSVIVPLELDVFKEMITASYNANYQPSPNKVKELFEYSEKIAETSSDEIEWYKKLTEKAYNWLT